MTPSKQQSKIEQSPHFQRVVVLYRQHKDVLSKKEIFKTYIEPLDPSLRYHQFVRLTVKLNGQVAMESGKVMAQYVEGEVNTAKMRQEKMRQSYTSGHYSLATNPLRARLNFGKSIQKKSPQSSYVISSRCIRRWSKCVKLMK